MGKAALRSAQTLVAAGVRDDGIHAATITIAGQVKPGTDFDPDAIAELFWTAHADSEGCLADGVPLHGRLARPRQGRRVWATEP